MHTYMYNAVYIFITLIHLNYILVTVMHVMTTHAAIITMVCWPSSVYIGNCSCWAKIARVQEGTPQIPLWPKAWLCYCFRDRGNVSIISLGSQVYTMQLHTLHYYIHNKWRQKQSWTKKKERGEGKAGIQTYIPMHIYMVFQSSILLTLVPCKVCW